MFAPIRSVVALDPSKMLSQYVHSVWGIEQELPQNTVRAIWQTRDGYIWLATEEGLALFDGVRFVVFDKVNTKAISHNDMYSLAEDDEGNLWIANQSGLQGRRWIGTNSGLKQLVDETQNFQNKYSVGHRTGQLDS